MHLAWTTITGDADGDTNCATLLSPLAVTQHTALVGEHGGAELDFQSADDFLTTTPASQDRGDFQSALVGSCKKQ
jgi:hypothetical protein